MWRRAIALVLCLSLTAGTAGCALVREKARELGGPQVAGAMELPAKGDASRTVDPRLAAANDDFGFRLLRELGTGRRTGNVLLSPFSATSALAMTANGASGPALDAMTKTLFADSLGLKDANAAYADLLARLQTDTPASKLAIANSLWLAEGKEFAPAFLAADSDYYAAEATSVRFGGVEANRRIDAWVDARTRGLIPTLLGDQPLDRDTLAVLVNALYFKADWQHEFDERDTHDETFTVSASEELRVPLMGTTSEFSYLGDPAFDAVRLPYKDGRRAMYVFVPKARDGLDQFVGSLDAERWAEWMRSFHEEEKVDVRLPRMKLASRADLKAPLTKLGMGPAFERGFETMLAEASPRPVAISDVLQAVTVEVDEKGTKAAAATAVVVGTMSAASVEQLPPQVIADHPFFFAIRDEPSGVLLFAGAVRDPR